MPKRKKKTNKGTPYERAMCSRLSKWWSQGDRDDLFWRSSGSGARASRLAGRGKDSVGHGDIVAVDKEGAPLTEMFTIELKRGYGRASFSDLFDQVGKTKYEEWLVKLIKSAREAGTPYWWLIVKRDYRHDLALLPDRFVSKFDLMSELSFYCPYCSVELGLDTHIEAFWVYRLADILHYVDPQDLLLRWTHNR